MKESAHILRQTIKALQDDVVFEEDRIQKNLNSIKTSEVKMTDLIFRITKMEQALNLLERAGEYES